MTRLALILCALLLLLAALPAWSQEVRVRDFRGKEVILAQPARRVVCLIESALSGIYMLGQGSRVKAVGRNVYQEPVKRFYAALDPRLARQELPAPGNWDFVNIESVVALRPDLVIIWAHQSEAIATLEARGIPVYGVFIRHLEEVYREIEDLGRLLGAGERAAELVALTKSHLTALARKLGPSPKRPRVYFMWAQGPLETSGAGSTVDRLIQLAGGVNVAGSIAQEHLVVNLERLLALNPHVVLMWYNPRLEPAELAQRPAWRALDAVREHRVHMFPGVFTCDLWTLKFAHAAWLAASWCHPSALAGMDLAASGGAFLARLYGPAILPALAPEGKAR